MSDVLMAHEYMCADTTLSLLRHGCMLAESIVHAVRRVHLLVHRGQEFGFVYNLSVHIMLR